MIHPSIHSFIYSRVVQMFISKWYLLLAPHGARQRLKSGAHENWLKMQCVEYILCSFSQCQGVSINQSILFQNKPLNKTQFIYKKNTQNAYAQSENGNDRSKLDNTSRQKTMATTIAKKINQMCYFTSNLQASGIYMYVHCTMYIQQHA